jgi:hypothetical protein
VTLDSRELLCLWGRLRVLNICVILAALHPYRHVTINVMESFSGAYVLSDRQDIPYISCTPNVHYHVYKSQLRATILRYSIFIINFVSYI